MRRLAIFGMVLLISACWVSKTRAADVDVRVRTPVGQVEVGQPPPPPVVVVPPPVPAPVVVEKRVVVNPPPAPTPPPPPPPSGGCHCEVVPSPALTGEFQCFVFLFFIGSGVLFLAALKRKKNRREATRIPVKRE